jgi:hypothetical protein
MDHDAVYARLGNVMTNALRDHLGLAKEVVAQSGLRFAIERISEPLLANGAWSLTFDLELPNDEGSVMFLIAQVGSGFDPAGVTVPLPNTAFEDSIRAEFPSAHKVEFFGLLDAVRKEFGGRGITVDDCLVFEDYYPSRGINVSVANMSMLTPDLAHACQQLVRNRPFRFWIQFTLDIKSNGYAGHNEALIVRDDRIIEDWDAERLRKEFGNRFVW